MKKVFVTLLTAVSILVGFGPGHSAEAMTRVYDEKGMRITVDESSIIWKQDNSSGRNFAVIVYEWEKYCLYEFTTDAYGRWLCTINSTTSCSPVTHAYVQAVLEFCLNYTGRPYMR